MGQDIDPNDREALEKAAAAGIVSVSRLVIAANRIERCLNIAPPPIPAKMSQLMGFGAIALAETEDLVIRDNYLAENGPDFLEPVCGIFVLMGEGIEISRNHILNNGLRRAVGFEASDVKLGPRGGIFIAQARTPGIDALPDLPRKVFFASGYPAAKIQENIVTVPFGRSLTLFARGPVSVVGNQFTSFGIPPVDLSALIRTFALAGGGLSPAALVQLLSLLAGNVLILNQALPAIASTGGTSYQAVANGSAGNALKLAGSSADGVTRRFFETGAVLFTNNQCNQNLFTPEGSFAVSSIFVASLDDIACHANQCDCQLDEDFLLVDALIFGFTVRVSDNHFAESFARVLLSALTFGIQNITSDNVSVHCLLVLGMQYLKRHNLVMLELGSVNGDVTEFAGEHLCDNLGQLFEAYGRMP
jgi:hypothetical protein